MGGERVCVCVREREADRGGERQREVERGGERERQKQLGETETE